MYFSTDVDRVGEPKQPGVGLGPVAAVELGAAVLSIGQALTSGGDFSSTSAPISYIHENTPPSQAWKSCRKEFLLTAYVPMPSGVFIPAPKPGSSWAPSENFWFALQFEYNGNDLREVKVEPLFDKSSTLYKSKFNISFTPGAASVPRDPVAAVRFTISGFWEKWAVPFNDKVSISGALNVKANGFWSLNISSEKGWVNHQSLVTLCPIVMPVLPKIEPPKVPIPIISQLNVFFSPPGSDRIRDADEARIVKWFQMLPATTRGKISAGTLPISIEGYASTTAGGAFNRELSHRRAVRVQRILQDIAGSSAQFRVNAYGKYQAGTADKVENANERRVRISVTDMTYR